MSPRQQGESRRPEAIRTQIRIIIHRPGQTETWSGVETGPVADALANLTRRATTAVSS